MMLLGNRRLVGQLPAREKLTKIVTSGRTSHAYLFAGPNGVGKKGMALAFAEMLQGIDHLTDLGSLKKSAKSSWHSHPDIHLFLPLPGTKVDLGELRERVQLLAKDPYEIVDFSLRPTLDSASEKVNTYARYAISYFRDHIKPAAYLKPNEGAYTIIIISNVESMGKEANNAFLKLLEEPPDRVLFLLTTDNLDSLLPTIISRCQLISAPPLSDDEICDALISHDQLAENEARFLSRISGGNYSSTRFFDLSALKENREEVVQFLRNSFTSDAVAIVKQATQWQSKFNNERLLGIFSMMEAFIRDLLVYRTTQNQGLITNSDQIDVIQKFCSNLEKARLDEMIEICHEFRNLLMQNINPKYLFTVMAMRFTYLMRGLAPVIPNQDFWKRAPITTQS